jgi:hypothetical protein
VNAAFDLAVSFQNQFVRDQNAGVALLRADLPDFPRIRSLQGLTGARAAEAPLAARIGKRLAFFHGPDNIRDKARIG